MLPSFVSYSFIYLLVCFTDITSFKLNMFLKNSSTVPFRPSPPTSTSTSLRFQQAPLQEITTRIFWKVPDGHEPWASCPLTLSQITYRQPTIMAQYQDKCKKTKTNKNKKDKRQPTTSQKCLPVSKPVNFFLGYIPLPSIWVFASLGNQGE